MATPDQIRQEWTAHDGFASDETLWAYFGHLHFYVGDLLGEIDRLQAQGGSDTETALAEALALLAVAQAQVAALTADLEAILLQYDTLVDAINSLPPHGPPGGPPHGPPDGIGDAL